MLPRSAVRKAAAGQRPELRAVDNRTRRPGQRQQFRARPRIRRPRRAGRQAGRRAVPEPGQRSRPSGQLTLQNEQYAEHPAVSCPGRREFTAVPPRSAIRPRLPSTTGCGNPPPPGSPGHAHGLPDSMPAPPMTVKPGDLRPPARPARRRPGAASRWPRHPPHRTHSHSPPRRRVPAPGQDAPAQANSPPRQLTPATARPASMTLDRDRPEILQPPEHPQACCAQQTITVPSCWGALWSAGYLG